MSPTSRVSRRWPTASSALWSMAGPRPLYFTAGRLRQEPGAAPGAELVVRTSSAFLDRWAAGEAGWDDGRARGEVITEGPPAAWPRWLTATGYLLQAEPDTTQEEVVEAGAHD